MNNRKHRLHVVKSQGLMSTKPTNLRDYLPWITKTISIMNWLELLNQLIIYASECYCYCVVGIAKRRVLDNNGWLAGQGCLTSLIKKMDVRLMRLFFLSPTCCWLLCRPRPHINHIMIFIHFCHNVSHLPYLGNIDQRFVVICYQPLFVKPL